MITNHSFICFGEDIGTTVMSKHHFMRHLSKQNTVLYVESIGVRRPQLSRHDAKRIVKKIKRWIRGCRKIEPNFYALSPVVIPLHHVPLIKKVNQILLKGQLRFWQWWLKMNNLILWIGLPTAKAVVGAMNEQLVVYHCADKLTAYVSPEERAPLEMMHQEMLDKADVTITPSQSFQQEMAPLTKACYYLPHGVDHDHFGTTQDPDLPIASDIQAIPGPIIGFYGTIDTRWVDFKMLFQIATTRPEWSFVLIGPTEHSRESHQLERLSNIHFLGPRPYSDLPTYTKAFDVCMLPKTQTSLTASSSPLKLREYLATGKPIVTTLEPDGPLASLVYVAKTAQDFEVGIEACLQSDTAEARQARMDSMQIHSWKQRTEQLSQILLDTLAKPSTNGTMN